MRSILRGGRRLRRYLGGVRDLPRDLDDVPVRVEDVELAVGAVAAAQDLLDAGELLLGAEVARVRADRLQCPSHEGRHWQPVAAPRGAVHDRARDSVAR